MLTPWPYGLKPVADDKLTVLVFAESVGMSDISMWSLARDQEDPAGALT